MSLSTPAVLAIGSCRVFRPLEPVHDKKRINLLNHSANRWYTHTAAAGRQYVDVVQGRAHIPAELREVALETHLDYSAEDMSSAEPIAPDVVILEVSTLKRHRVDGVDLNAHLINGVQRAHPDGLPDGHPLTRLDVSTTSPEELAEEVLAIRDRLGAPVITVNHLYSLTPDGEPSPARETLTGMLREVEAEHGIPLFDTKDVILEHGIDVALEDQNHYRRSFEPVVAERLLAFVDEQLLALRAS